MLKPFLSTLWDTGLAEVSSDSHVTEKDTLDIGEYLASLELEYRNTLPNQTPGFDLSASQWSVLMLYRACQCVVCRDIDAEQAVSMLSSPKCPISASPTAHYSVDLLFRFLPDVVQRASTVGEDDPILEVLRGWCHAWPLSSVGVPNVSDVDIDSIASNPCLMMMYTNRIVERKDRSRVAHPLVHTYLRKVAGNYDQLVSEWIKDE